MGENKFFRFGFNRKLCGKLRIHVRPVIGNLSAEQCAFRDKQIGISGKFFGVFAVTGIGALTYNFAVDFKPVTETF